MRKKDRQFANSQVWLDWLSDNTPAESETNSRPVQRTTPIVSTHTPRVQMPRQDLSGFRVAMPRSNVRSVQTPTAVPQGLQPLPRTPKRPIVEQKQHEDTVVINFHLPQLQIPRLHVPWRKVGIGMGVVTLLMACILSAPYIIRQLTHKETSAAQTTASNQPAYSPLVPQSDSTSSSQVKGERYIKAQQLYQYADTYEGVSLTVSQQPLPDSFRTDPTKLKAAATAIGANESVTTTNGVVYISTGDSLTSQRLMFASNQLLVFITANGVLKNAEWVNYVQSLTSKV